jgi:hypothetical protein
VVDRLTGFPEFNDLVDAGHVCPSGGLTDGPLPGRERI